LSVALDAVLGVALAALLRNLHAVDSHGIEGAAAFPLGTTEELSGTAGASAMRVVTLGC